MNNTTATKQKVLLIGAGAVGSTIAAWLAPKQNEFYVLDQGEVLEAISKDGVFCYLQDQKESGEQVMVNTIERLEDCPAPDVILLCVKNYSLEGLSKAILGAYGDDCAKNTVIVGLQNGIDNQRILPKYFRKVVYGIITFNAWLDAPGVVGCQAKGPFIFAAQSSDFDNEVRLVTEIFNQGVKAIAYDRLEDAVLSKIILNLTNSFTTLMGMGFKDIDDMSLFQKILSEMLYEGVRIAKAAGYQECHIGDAPPWWLIRAAAQLPQFLTRGIFKRKVKVMVMSSMAQDIIQNSRSDNELEGINGHLLDLAEKYRVDAPFNRSIYDLCKQEFAKPNFQPLDVSEIWRRMNFDGKDANLKNAA